MMAVPERLAVTQEARSAVRGGEGSVPWVVIHWCVAVAQRLSGVHLNMLDPTPLGIRPLQANDLPLLHRWFAAPRVSRWYRTEATLSYDGIVAKYGPRIKGQEPVQPFLIMYEALPIGYIQTYMFDDVGACPNLFLDDTDVAGLDLFIGDDAYLHRGLGVPILHRFLHDIVFGALCATACVVDPERENAGAIRTYEKAGFHRLSPGQPQDTGPSTVLMRIDAPEVRE